MKPSQKVRIIIAKSGDEIELNQPNSVRIETQAIKSSVQGGRGKNLQLVVKVVSFKRSGKRDGYISVV